MVEENEELDETAAGIEDDGADAQINDTDIVFDCPHCGHNLCIDYRGAGLQITCSECGEAVLVPIPARPRPRRDTEAAIRYASEPPARRGACRGPRG